MAKIKDNVKLKGKLIAVLRDPSGKIKNVQVIRNTVTTLGRAHWADRMQETPAQTPITKMEIGTGTGGTTTLNALIATWGTMTLVSRTTTGAVVTYNALFTATADSITVTEAGLLNSTNVLVNYVSTLVQLMNTGDTLEITWNTTVS